MKLLLNGIKGEYVRNVTELPLVVESVGQRMFATIGALYTRTDTGCVVKGRYLKVA